MSDRYNPFGLSYLDRPVDTPNYAVDSRWPDQPSVADAFQMGHLASTDQYAPQTYAPFDAYDRAQQAQHRDEKQAQNVQRAADVAASLSGQAGPADIRPVLKGMKMGDLAGEMLAPDDVLGAATALNPVKALGKVGRAVPAMAGAVLGSDPAEAAFGGPRAKTANLGMLERAKNLFSKEAPRDEIWTGTGWYKGADDKWKFEIPDEAARFRVNPIPDESRMGSVFRHKELYDAYPQLADIDLNMQPVMGGGRGSYQGWDNAAIAPTITLDPKNRTMRDVNLHELQHAVQDIEGFATGGNTMGLRPDTPAWDIYQERLRAIRTPTPKAELEKAGVIGDSYTYEDYLREHKQALRDDKRGLDRAAQEYAVNDAYRRLAGEVEARNVQHRASWDAQKRRDIPPDFSQDVPNEKQIVRFRDPPLGSLADPFRYQR